MTESSRASSTSIQIFLKTDIFFSPFFVFRFFFSKGGRVTLRLAAGEIPKSDKT